MRITYDPNKRAKTLAERDLDFEDAAEVFAGATFDIPDRRRPYGEDRVLCYGYLRGRLDDWLHGAWRGSTRVQHEESQ